MRSAVLFASVVFLAAFACGTSSTTPEGQVGPGGGDGGSGPVVDGGPGGIGLDGGPAPLGRCGCRPHAAYPCAPRYPPGAA